MRLVIPLVALVSLLCLKSSPSAHAALFCQGATGCQIFVGLLAMSWKDWVSWWWLFVWRQWRLRERGPVLWEGQPCGESPGLGLWQYSSASHSASWCVLLWHITFCECQVKYCLPCRVPANVFMILKHSFCYFYHFFKKWKGTRNRKCYSSLQ